ncbi:hypothetical protein MTP99_015738 [Tenebrio molitor]|jgi:hypothetical protein|nr:hypothetical protein MTP99_015738 [Tenebrio molitor]
MKDFNLGPLAAAQRAGDITKVGGSIFSKWENVWDSGMPWASGNNKVNVVFLSVRLGRDVERGARLWLLVGRECGGGGDRNRGGWTA